MELWLAEDRWGSAVALVACHALPPYVVDAAIYSEVRHGIHPWITGKSRLVSSSRFFKYGPDFLGN